MVESTVVNEVMDNAEAEMITARIREWVKAYPTADIARAYRGRVWVSMGYDSWFEWCDCELDGFKLPSAEDRHAVVVELSSTGMSQRSVAEAVGVGVGTVNRDLAKAGVPSGTGGRDQKVTGQDGKTYPRRGGYPDDPKWDAARDYAKLSRIVRSLSWMADQNPESAGHQLGWDACSGRGNLADEIARVRDWLTKAEPAIRGLRESV